MKNQIVVILLFVFTFSHAQNEINRGYKVKVGDMLPPIELHMLSGETWTNKDLKNKIVVLQFTGSWCSVCRKEMPQLEERVWQKFKNDDFLLIGIDIKDSLEKVSPFIEKTGVTYPIAWDPEAIIFRDFTLEGAGVTRNIVVNRNGEIVFLTRLYKEDEFQKMIKIIEQLL